MRKCRVTASLFGILALFATCGALILAQGCKGTSTTSSSDAEMRKTMMKKNWSINDVPADKRAMVEAFMNQSKAGGAPKAPAPGANPAPSKP
jgi:hypothetical protein